MTTPVQGSGKRWLRRVGWLALIWVASAAALAIVALTFRAVMSAAGLTASH